MYNGLELLPQRTLELFEQLLKKLNLAEYSVFLEPVLSAEESNTGFIVKAQVDCEKRHRFIIKCGLITKTTGKIPCNVSRMFSREIYSYEKIFPEFEKLQLEKGVNPPYTFYPKFYDSLNEENNEAIILEDMSSFDYVVKSDLDTLDHEHVTKALQEYARLHALSFALRDQKNDILNSLVKGISYFYSAELSNPLLCAYRESHTRAINILDYDKEKELYKTIDNIYQNYPKIIKEVFADRFSSNYSVFTHTDCRLGNLLFKYGQDGIVSKVCLLDWQIASITSPAVDVVHVILVNTDKNTRDKHYDEWIRGYYANFCSFLRQLGSDPERLLPFEVLQEHLQKYAIHSFLFTTFTLHTILKTTEDYNNRMKDIMTDCYNLGFLKW